MGGVRSRPFRLLQATITLWTLVLYAVTFTLIALLLERGVSYQSAAVAFGLTGVGQVIGGIAYSALAPTPSAVARTLVLTAAGAGSVWALAPVPGPTGLLVVVAVVMAVLASIGVITASRTRTPQRMPG